MARKVETDEGAREQLWAQLDKGRVSMLWLKDSAQHPQPMTHFTDEGDGVLWYITSSDTDLAQGIDAGRDAALTYVSSNQDYHASVTGRLEIVQDAAKLDELWSTPVAAWFEGGRDDPKVCLLRFTPDEAAIWASEANMVLVGLKLLRAGLSEGGGYPDIGVHRVIKLADAA
ncbi:pyridoxamine 5'-phosphate oxidase family protein [Tropicimonas aquimaris]|uniref:Pyridoxamine 5'-phosphate oxidase family protein n=1 Tax=Tropicimonas aquimaris TaxID=914152 RepID=A0ABW3IXI2_9RHOB